MSDVWLYASFENDLQLKVIVMALYMSISFAQTKNDLNFGVIFGGSFNKDLYLKVK